MDKSTATFEILIMLFVAFAIGFIIAWLLRKSRLSTVHHDELAKLTADKDRKISVLEKDKVFLIEKNNQLTHSLELCKTSLEEAKLNQKTAIEEIPTVKESDRINAEKLGFKVASPHQKDDLTRISGVGPFIEQKLNNLGIYSFDQISGFTPETIVKVTEAIEFFPGRIERDNWILQARQFANEKSVS